MADSPAVTSDSGEDSVTLTAGIHREGNEDGLKAHDSFSAEKKNQSDGISASVHKTGYLNKGTEPLEVRGSGETETPLPGSLSEGMEPFEICGTGGLAPSDLTDSEPGAAAVKGKLCQEEDELSGATAVKEKLCQEEDELSGATAVKEKLCQEEDELSGATAVKEKLCQEEDELSGATAVKEKLCQEEDELCGQDLKMAADPGLNTKQTETLEEETAAL